ncbi:unnamed protein product, partial [Rotaria sp. Silwood2]
MYSKAGEVVQEVFSSLRTVLSLNGEKIEEKRYESKLQATRWSSMRKGAVFGLLGGWIYLIGYLIYSIGFAFGLSLMSHEGYDRLSFSDLLVIIIPLARIITNIAFVSPFFQLLEEARGALAPVFRLIDEEEVISMNETQILKDSVICKEAIDMNGDIQFDNINFVYPARPDVLVLRNLTLTARAGETTALVGTNGSGKSTCVSLLLRFYEPSSGHISISDRPITDYNLTQLRQNIGVVSQEPILFSTSIYENIRFGKEDATRIEIEEAARQANAHDFIMKLPNKYDTVVGERSVQLSGGEKQRVALARALVKQPSLLLLDEATSALDHTNEKIVQEALDKACKDRTTIVIAHRLTTIEKAHRIYVLDNGRVIEQGTHEILMSKEGGRYRKMMNAQHTEKIENGIDETMDLTQIEDDDQQQIFDRSRQSSYNNPDVRDEYTAFAVSGSKLTERICAKAFAHYLRQEMTFFDNHENSSGAICNRLSSDALAIQQMVGSRLGIVFESVAMFGLGIILGFVFSWQLTLTMLFFIISLFVLSFIQVCWQARLNKHSDDIFGLASSLAVEIIHNMRTVKKLAIEGEFLRQFSNLIHKEYKYVEVNCYSFKMFLKPICKGASGSGKSTVIQLLERFYDPIQGQICLDGVDIRQLNIQWLRSCFGLVIQEPILFNLTIAQNIAYGRENVSIEDIIDAATKANIHDFIQRLPEGYDTNVGMKGGHLSGGEKQRIALARVLLRQPKILLLDEATSAMDSCNEQIVQEALEKAETDDPARTSLIITHRLSTI